MKDLSELLNQHAFTSSINHIGPLHNMKHYGDAGQLHLLEEGKIRIHRQGSKEILMNKPSLLFLPKPVKHQVEPVNSTLPHVISASIRFSLASPSFVLNALPDELYMELGHNTPMSWTVKWLVDEIRQQRFGKSTMIDRLGEMFMLQILRYAAEHDQLHEGTLLAINHPQLSKVMNAIHANPAKSWKLETLAELAAMSRSKFAEAFKAAVGQTPNDYITSLRVALAQKLLKTDKSVNFVAYEVGYEHGSALTRNFKKKLGLTPRQWLQLQTGSAGTA